MDKNFLKKVADYIWEISKFYLSDMRVLGRIYISEKMIDNIVNVVSNAGLSKKVARLVPVSCD